jgi:membrane-bound ClpP family serine protease
MINKSRLVRKPLALLAEEALKKAVADVIAEHKRTGEPLVIWRDGKVVKIPADQLEVREAQTEYSEEKKSKKNGY